MAGRIPEEVLDILKAEACWGTFRVHENGDGIAEIDYCKYLDDGYGWQAHVNVHIEYPLDDGKEPRITVNGYTREDVEKEREKLMERCPKNGECPCYECDVEECEIYDDLFFLDQIDIYLEYLEDLL